MKRTVMTALLAILVGFAAPAPLIADNERPWATIGTGALTGVYYNAGQAIAKTVNRYPGERRIDISVEETQGSLENLDAVATGRFYFGFIQSDLQHKAWHGLAGTPWSGKPQSNLRAVFSLHTEAINLVAAGPQDIPHLQDLISRRMVINLGEIGSGNHVNAIEILDAVGFGMADVRHVEISPVLALDYFEWHEIDAFFFTAGHPAPQFREIAGGRRPARFVPLNPKAELLAKYPYYKRTSIPIKYYPGIQNDQDVPSVGVKATLVASALTPDWMVYGMVKAVAENLDYFKTQLLVFENLHRAGMLEGLAAPLHPGAQKYYREAGLMP
jgi:TRAP transporter TAXI family solute receptor